MEGTYYITKQDANLLALLLLLVSASAAGYFVGGECRKPRTWIAAAVSFISLVASMLIRFASLAVLVVVLASTAHADWGYKRTITVASGTVASDLSGFPVLVAGTYSYLATVANGGRIQNANGYDVAFFSDEALTTQLAHEVEKWSGTDGSVAYWVKIPTLATGSDTVIYMAYGNSDISTSQEDIANVWDSNYKIVQHLKEDPSGTAPQAIDSTSNNNDMTSNGTMLTEDLVAAKIGNGLEFDGTDDYMSVSDNAGLSVTGALTVSCWFNMTNNPGAASEGLVSKYLNMTGYSNQRSYELVITTSGQPSATVSTDGTFSEGSASNSSTYAADRANGSWHLFVMVFIPSTSLTLYLNGSQVAQNTTSIVSSVYDGTAPLLIGTQLDTTGANYVANAKIDEVRVSNTNRSANWIAAEYANQNSPATFYAVGDEAAHTGSGARRRIVIAQRVQ